MTVVVLAGGTGGAKLARGVVHLGGVELRRAGDKGDAKRAVAELIARVPGLRPVNAGRLEAARLIEGITPLLISVNARYKTTAGVKLTALPDELW